LNFDARPSEPDTRSEPTTPTADANCGTAGRKTVRMPVDVLLVLDRSNSMTDNIGQEFCYCDLASAGGEADMVCADAKNCTSRWNAIKDAMKTTLANSSYVNWGLKFFSSPGAGECNVAAGPDVPVGPSAAPTVQAKIESGDQSFSTPTAAAINAAVAYLKKVDDNNKRFILLATDGEPNCGKGSDGRVSMGNDDVDGAVKAMADAKAAGFPAYVIGIGPSIDNLGKLAKAGADRDYFPASSPAALADALSSIGKIVASCSYFSDTPPPEPANVAVYVNKQKVSRSDSEGWKYGASEQEIVLTGKYCQDILAGADSDVQILFGCPGSTYFPPQIF
jgi:hypothetical protein